MQRRKAILGLAALFLAALPALAASRVPPVASYRIEAAWDGEQKTLAGRETVTFVNRTSRELPDVVLHLYLNGFRNTRSTLWRGLPPPSGSAAFGFCELKRVALPDGTDLTRRISFETPAGDNPDDRTLARVPLPRPVRPGETLVLEVDFESRLPRGILRTGWKDDFVFAGQWFPKLAKATDAGWRGRPFHSSTEFFADFGSYEVTLLLPAEMKGKVAATGRVVEEADEAAGRVRVRAHAEDVHDFAFAFSPRFEVRRETVAPKGLPKVDVLLFLQPDHRRSRERYPSRRARRARPLRNVADALPVPGTDDRRPAHRLRCGGDGVPDPLHRRDDLALPRLGRRAGRGDAARARAPVVPGDARLRRDERSAPGRGTRELDLREGRDENLRDPEPRRRRRSVSRFPCAL